jgi:N-acetylneuraminate synthase
MIERKLTIGNRLIGSGEPCFIIAEAGVNHNGSMVRAKQLIDAAAMAGADAVKFQKRNLEEIYQKKVLDNPNDSEQKYQFLIPMLKEFELSNDQFKELEKYAKEKGIMFLVNPWDIKSADKLEELFDIPFYKIGSPDLTNSELLSHVADFGKPMVLSTGMSTTEEIKETVKLLEENKVNFALLHCNSTYPAPFDKINLKFMEKLREFGVPVGYSGHERGITVAMGAVAMGASIIERHLTTDKNLEGTDHKASLLPEEFKQMVQGIREVEMSLGKAERILSQGEMMNREILGKSIIVGKFIPDGTIITREMLEIKSPAKGLSPQRLKDVVGVTAQRDIFAGEFITEDDLKDDSLMRNFRSDDIKWQWGIVVRFHDFQKYLPYEPKLFEFHLSDKDLEMSLPDGNFKQELIVHAPEYSYRTYLNLVSVNKEERELALKNLQKSLDLTKKLGEKFTGKPKFVFHSGGVTLAPYDKPQELVQILVDMIGRLKGDGVEILPENLPARNWIFGGEYVTNIFMFADEIKKILDQTGLKMCFDTSHSMLACNMHNIDIYEEIKKLRPYISHMHISDGAGVGEEGLQVGKGEIDWAKLMGVMDGYQNTMVPEIWQGHLHNGRGFFQALTHLKGYMK